MHGYQRRNKRHFSAGLYVSVVFEYFRVSFDSAGFNCPKRLQWPPAVIRLFSSYTRATVWKKKCTSSARRRSGRAAWAGTFPAERRTRTRDVKKFHRQYFRFRLAVTKRLPRKRDKSKTISLRSGRPHRVSTGRRSRSGRQAHGNIFCNYGAAADTVVKTVFFLFSGVGREQGRKRET